jgi:hypothetical protein
VFTAEDQPRARALLRDAGVAPATRFADELARSRAPKTEKSRHALGMYIRLGLLAIIAILIMLYAFGLF